MKAFLLATAGVVSFQMAGLCIPAAAQRPPSSFGSTPPAPHAQPQVNEAGIAFTMGELGRRTSYGQDGIWLTTAKPDGSLVFANRSNSSGWNATIIPSPNLPYTMQVEVNTDIPAATGRAVGAGLVFADQRGQGSQPPTYYAVMIAGNTINVYRYDGSFNTLVTSTRTGTGPRQQWDTLQVTVRSDGFSLALNGEQFNSMSTDDQPTGEVGVIVSGVGTASFRNLTSLR